MFLPMKWLFCLGIINVLTTTPLWVANTRLKLQGAKLHTDQYKKRSEEKSHMIRYDGIIGKYQIIIS